jgi:hypothetical protein
MNRSIVLGLLTLACTAAPAQDWSSPREWAYVGGGGGPSAVGASCEGGGNGCTNSSQGGRLVAGVFVQRGLALELLGINFGKARLGQGSGGSTETRRMLGFGSALQLELGGGLAAQLRGGVAAVRSVREGAVNSRAVGGGSDGYAGVSLLYRVNRQVAIEASFDALGFDGQRNNDSSALGSIGVSLRF